MPLQEVAQVVAAAGPEAADLIESYWASQERRFAAQRQIAATLSARRDRLGSAKRPAPGARAVRAGTASADRATSCLSRSADLDAGSHRPTRRHAQIAAAVSRDSVLSSSTAWSQLTATDRSRCAYQSLTCPMTRRAGLAGRTRASRSIHSRSRKSISRSQRSCPSTTSWHAGSQPRAAKQIGSPREVYTPGVEPLFAAADTHICDVAIPFAPTSSARDASPTSD